MCISMIFFLKKKSSKFYYLEQNTYFFFIITHNKSNIRYLSYSFNCYINLILKSCQIKQIIKIYLKIYFLIILN